MKLRGHLIATLLIGASLFLLFAAGVQAHGLGGAWVQVPGGLVRPGEDFEVWGADFGPYATVELFFSTGERIGQVSAGADGHFTTTIQAPDQLAEGFAELNATTEDGVWSAVWVQVGSSNSGAAASAWWSDPSALLLSVVLVVGALAIAVVLIRRRPIPQQSLVRTRTTSRKPMMRKRAARRS